MIWVKSWQTPWRPAKASAIGVSTSVASGSKRMSRCSACAEGRHRVAGAVMPARASARGIGGNRGIRRHAGRGRDGNAAGDVGRQDRATAAISRARSASGVEGPSARLRREPLDPGLKVQRDLVMRAAKGELGRAVAEEIADGRSVRQVAGEMSSCAGDQALFARQVGGHQPRQMPPADGGAGIV